MVVSELDSQTMRSKFSLSILVILLVSIGCSSNDSLKLSQNNHAIKAVKEKFVQAYGQMPLFFEENRGQVREKIKFLARGMGYGLGLEPTRATFVMSKGTEGRRVLIMDVVGGNASASITGLENKAGKSNYLIGSSKEGWLNGVPHFGRVMVSEVYPGIDLIYYGNQRQLEFDFVVKPQTDPKIIKLDFEGVETVQVDKNGHLVLRSAHGDTVLRAPVIYQENTGKKRKVNGRYVVRETGIVGFEVEDYDKNKELVIDPILVYSTYLGGSGGENGQFGGFSIEIDSGYNIYVTGTTDSVDFPLLNPLQSVPGGSEDAFITKFNATGTLVYSTYLGGNGQERAHGIAVDDNVPNNIYVTGWTTSPNFPLVNPIQGTMYGSLGDAFVTKIDATGSAIIYSTYLGGDSVAVSTRDAGHDIAVDNSGNAYVIGVTSSSGFPLVNPIQGVHGGSSDVFVTKINPTGTALVYSTFLGGSGTNAGHGITVDSVGNAYISGETVSGFPLVNPLQGSYGGGFRDAFIAKINATGTLVYSTYLGGSGSDSATDIAVDTSGNTYVTGSTSSVDFPLANPIQPILGGGGDAFISKINSAGSAIVYSTYLGGDEGDIGWGIAVDSVGKAYVTGITGSTNFPLANPMHDVLNGDSLRTDAFITTVNAAGNAWVHSSYLGGSHRDQAKDLVVDNLENAYIVGWTRSTDFPVANPHQSTNAGGRDAFITKIGNPTTPSPPTPTPTPTPPPTSTPLPTNTYTPSPTELPPPDVWPIPFNPSTAFDGVLKAEILLDGSSFKIFTITGELIADIKPINGRAEWNGRNRNGRMVHAGTYYYYIQRGKKRLKSGTIIVLNER